MKATKRFIFRLVEADVECVGGELARLGGEGTLSRFMRDYMARLAADLRAASSDKRKREILKGVRQYVE